MDNEVVEELLARKRASESLVDYTKYIDVPGRPIDMEMQGNKWVYGKEEDGIAQHHCLLLRKVQEVIEGKLPRMMVFMPPGSAKALEINTPIITRDGWKRMKDLTTNDYVLSPRRGWRRVTRVSEIFHNRKCYNVGLRGFGKHKVIADEDHLWDVCKLPKLQRDIAKTKHKIMNTKNLHIEAKYRHARVRALWLNRSKKKDSFIGEAKYGLILGLWFGGRTAVGSLEMRLPARGTQLLRMAGKMGEGLVEVRKGVYTSKYLEEALYIAGIDIYTRELPVGLLFESVIIRKAIMKGLIYCKCKYYGEYLSVIKKDHIDNSIMFLMRSLGLGTVGLGDDNLINHGMCVIDYRRTIKYDIYEVSEERASRYDTMCISVDGELFCAGRALIPTHNSTYSTVVSPTWAMGKYPGTKIILASYGGDLAKKHGRKARAIVKSDKFRNVFNDTISDETAAADFWGTTGESEYMSAGILSGITGNRAHGIIIDDPIRGRADAESDVVCNRTWDAYVDDLRTRLIPNGWEILVQTRWSMGDLAGRLLPDDYDGHSGLIGCKDGRPWYVLCLPAIAERDDDPLGRKIGQRLWPEWFTQKHFDGFKSNARTWSALFQQRPAPEEGTFFKREWFHMYKSYELPKNLHVYITSDFAVSADKGDYTEHGVWGIDEKGHLWQVGWWHDQATSDIWIKELLRLMEVFKPLCWFGEGGVIRRAIEPFLIRQMQEDKVFCRIEWINPISDKATRARGFQAMASQGMVHLSDNEDGKRLLEQLITFPAGRYDDAVDVCGLMGLVLEQAHKAIIERGGVKKMTQAEQDWVRIRGMAGESAAVNVDIFDEVGDEYF